MSESLVSSPTPDFSATRYLEYTFNEHDGFEPSNCLTRVNYKSSVVQMYDNPIRTTVGCVFLKWVPSIIFSLVTGMTSK